jgi:hypothetical protein
MFFFNENQYYYFQAWEMLVLSKMDWDVNLVIAHDYLDSLTSLMYPSMNPEDNELENAKLICCLSSKSTTFRATHGPRIVSLSSLLIQNEGHLSQDKLCSLVKVSQDDLKVCLNTMGPQLWACLGQITPKKYQSCPTKLSTSTPKSSTTTPKSSRLPLKERETTEEFNILVKNTRRRLTSMTEDHDETNNKENNDSAIGLLNASNLTSPTNSSTSRTSSKQSSPDSGASSGSPSSRNDQVQELDQLLGSTHISPPCTSSNIKTQMK